ncbi:MAG: hypothetical protein AAF531_11240 [Actinomycetota bacterium]
MKNPRTREDVQAFSRGTWTSLSVELRPTEDRTDSGVIEPTRLTRDFTFRNDDTFTGVITMYVDDYGKLPLMRFEFRGHLLWGDAHPIAEGAWIIDYVLDDGFGVTPLSPEAAEMLNAALPPDLEPFQVDVQQDILGKSFPLFSIDAGEILTDHDLIYFHSGLLFMGAKHVDGTPFDLPERRPHQLQVPLARVSS